MRRSPFARHRFPPEIIRHTVWLYLRFTLSFREVEDLLAERGLDVSYETIRRWVLKFGGFVGAALSEPLLQGGVMVSVLAYMIHLNLWLGLTVLIFFPPQLSLRSAYAGRDEPANWVAGSSLTAA